MGNQVDHVIEEAKQLSYEELKAASDRILDMIVWYWIGPHADYDHL